MERIENVKEIRGKSYNLVYNYMNNNQLRKGLNSLTNKTYGFDFEQWYQDGYWTEKYVPYSLLDGDKVVSNVSVNYMDFLIESKKEKLIQIGTVMTDEEYRGQGLSRVLLEKVLSDCENSEIIYLFANSTVLDFYPKFGFQRVEEFQYLKSIKEDKVNAEVNEIKTEVKKLDISIIEDKELLLKLIEISKPTSPISMINNPGLLLFYCTGFLKNNLYYIPIYNAVVVAEYDKEILYLHEIFSTEPIKLEDVIRVMQVKETTKVILGFAPLEDKNTYEKRSVTGDALFIKSSNIKSIQLEGCFPKLSHA